VPFASARRERGGIGESDGRAKRRYRSRLSGRGGRSNRRRIRLRFVNNLDLAWEYPPYTRFLRRLTSFSRLILMDRRGTGLSDRFSPRDPPPRSRFCKTIFASFWTRSMSSAPRSSDGRMQVACAPSSPQHIRSERTPLPSSPRCGGYRQASAATIAHLAEFIALDRLRCPFIRHGLFVEPDAGSSGRATSRGQTQRCCPGDPRLRLPVAPQRAPGTSNSEAVAHLAVL
jgi:hypothetical protein